MNLVTKYKKYYTALAHEDALILPRAVIADVGFTPGAVLKAIIWDGGRLEINNDVDEDRFDGAQFGDHKTMTFHPAVFENLGLRPGDIVRFDVLGVGRLSVEKLATPESDPKFLDPKLDDEGYPIPPGWLVQAFAAHPEPDDFLAGGRAVARQICGLVKDAGEEIGGFTNIVDFGCGCGRVIHGFRTESPAELIGIDLHRSAVDWCRWAFPYVNGIYGTEFPPTALPDSSVDLLYAISVLTHLDEQHQDAWLREWQRMIKPGGLAIITYRNEDYIKAFSNNLPDWAEVDQLLANGLLFKSHMYWEGIFPDYYQGTFHSEDYVLRHWSKFFDILWTVKAGNTAIGQNVAIMRKR